jgi:hypothetical protein
MSAPFDRDKFNQTFDSIVEGLGGLILIGLAVGGVFLMVTHIDEIVRITLGFIALAALSLVSMAIGDWWSGRYASIHDWWIGRRS